MKAIPHSHILVVWPGSDPFPSDTKSLSLLFPLGPSDTNTTSPQVFSSQTSIVAHQSGVCYTRPSVSAPGGPRLPFVSLGWKKGTARFALRSRSFNPKRAAGGAEDVPGLIRRWLQGRQSAWCLDVPAQAENRRNTLPRGGRRIVWLEGGELRTSLAVLAGAGGKVCIKGKRKQPWFEVGY